MTTLTPLNHVQTEIDSLEEALGNIEKDTNAKTFVTFKKEIVDSQYKATNANQIERKKTVEICSEGKRRTPILSPASVIQTEAKLNNTAEGDRGAQIPFPTSVMLTTTTSVDRISDEISDSKRRTENLSPASVTSAATGGFKTTASSTTTLPECKQVDLTITTKAGAATGRVCSDTEATSIVPAAESRRVGLTTAASAVDKAVKGVRVGTVATSIFDGETHTPVCSETVENPAASDDEHKPFNWDTAVILVVGETDTTGSEVAKVEMEKKQSRNNNSSSSSRVATETEQQQQQQDINNNNNAKQQQQQQSIGRGRETAEAGVTDSSSSGEKQQNAKTFHQKVLHLLVVTKRTRRL